MAIGEESQAKANSSLALGAGAKVTVENSVSLGADSYADEIGDQAEMTINGCTYTFAGQQAQGTVVRTITDVGAGRVLSNSTDSINGSQLYAVTTELDKGWNVTTGSVSGGTVTGTQSLAQGRNGETVQFNAGKNVNIDQNDQTITVSTQENVSFTNVNTGNLTATDNTSVNNFSVKNGVTVDMCGNRVTNVGTPTAENDATNKAYVDNGRTQVTSADKSVTISKTKSSTGNADVYDLKVNANVSYSADNGKGSNSLNTPINFAGVANETVTSATDGKVTVGLADAVKDSLKKADAELQEFTVGADKNHAQTGIKVNQTTSRFDIVGTDDFVNTTVDGTSVKVDIADKFKDTVSNNTKNIANNTKNIADNSKKIEDNTQNITNNANNISN